MSNRTGREAATSRAEARRRARYLAQGRDLGDVVEDEEPAAQARGPAPVPGGFLGRLFPAAPPLPGKPDPLAGFHYTGPFRGIVAGLFLLSRSPTAWVLPAGLWAVAEIMFRLSLPSEVVGTMASLAAFGALIAAGWIGWQRPWLFGLAAAVLGVILFSGILGTAALMTGVPAGVYVALVSQELLQLAFGAVAGWYGGYLRRRLASQPSAARSARRR